MGSISTRSDTCLRAQGGHPDEVGEPWPTPVHFTLLAKGRNGHEMDVTAPSVIQPPRREMTSCERSPGLIFPLGGVSSIHGYLIFSLNSERVKAD